MNLYDDLNQCSFALKFDNLLTVWADTYKNGKRLGVQIEIPIDVYPDWLPASQHEVLRDMWDIQQGNAKTFTE